MAAGMGMAVGMLSGESAEDCMADASTAADSGFGTEGFMSGSLGPRECMGRRNWGPSWDHC